MEHDLVIIGGGPSGLATAIWARQRGLSCALLERRSPPLDKACGEGLMPAGVAALGQMGVSVGADRTHAFAGIRYIDRGATAEGRFSTGAGLGIRRYVLIEAMIARARELGVELRYGCAASSWRQDAEGVQVTTPDSELSARHLVAADGLHSPVRKELGLSKTWRGRPRFGMRRHFRVRPWASFVEVYWSRDVEAYVTPIADDEVGVAMLYPGDGRRFDELLGGFEALGQHLDGAPSTSEPRGAGPFRQGVARRYAGRVALVGDAAGYLDALTGEGLTLGFHCAEALTEILAEGRALAEYEVAYRRLSRTYYQLTDLLLAIGARPALRRRVIRMLAKHPDLFDRMLAITAGERPVRSVGVGGLMRMLTGLV